MNSEILFRSTANYEAFTTETMKYFGYATITEDLRPSLRHKIYQILSFINGLALTLMMIAYIGLGCDSLIDRFSVVSPLNYYITGLGKVIVFIYYRWYLISALQDLKKISPSTSVVQRYGLEHYLRNYKIMERLIYEFFKYIILMITLLPVVQSFVVYFVNHEFGYKLPINVWPLLPNQNRHIIYTIYCLMTFWSMFVYAFANFASDMSAISFLTQLCMHFDMLAQRIADLKPETEESLEHLNDIIRHHQYIVKISRNIDIVYAPAVGLNLMSSSFIICFFAYQMLDNVSPIIAVKCFLSLCYELKQIALICYYGDKLKERSTDIFNAIYMHEWDKGSLKYRRQVIFLLMITQNPIAISIARVTDVSLNTLRQVLSNAYQIFAVLKSA